ncbi:MAG: right-handed parallel beta-helix repeat-containing protein, partial [Gammaproteobacteria bacterium]
PGDLLFCQIQEAVDAASPGDEIEVEEGSYNENVEITTSDIRLDGDDATVDGTGLGGIGIHVVGASDVEIKGFIVENFDTGIVLTDVYHSRLRDIETRFNDDLADEIPAALTHDGLQVINYHQNLISDVFAHDNGHNGITLGVGSTNNTLEDNISNLNGTNLAIPTFGCGIELRSDGNNNNSITENEILGNGWGILLGFGGGLGADGNIIEENEIHGNVRTGIDVKDGSSGNFMIENDATGNAGFSDDFSLDFDLNDGGPFDNTWEDNEGTSSF